MLDQILPVLAVVALLAGSSWLLYVRSGGRWWSPLWLAFSATATSTMFVGAGIIGYMLSKRQRFLAGTGWSDTVIWWQIWVGLAAAVVALVFWRVGLRGIRADQARLPS